MVNPVRGVVQGEFSGIRCAKHLAAEEAGEAPPAEELFAAHPDLADELRRFLADRHEVAAALPGRLPRPPDMPRKARYVGDYEPIDVIARGGMGVVYKARQTTLIGVVAVKLIFAGYLASKENVILNVRL